jgi:hypothetical protein
MTRVHVRVVLLCLCSVQTILWDDGCYFCSTGSELCRRYALDANSTIIRDNDLRTCASEQTECDKDKTNCDLKVYIVWTGTDSQGNNFRSAGLLCVPCARACIVRDVTPRAGCGGVLRVSGFRFSRYLSFGLDSLYSSALKAADNGINNARVPDE